MRKLTAALGANALAYEAIALRIVDLIDSTGVSLEVGAVALKIAQVILDAKQRDGWDATWTRLEQTNFASPLDLEAFQEPRHAVQV
jgi:hypothetical protein